MPAQNEINIVFASDDNYIQHATVAMMSILQNTNQKNKLHFWILDDNITQNNKERVIATFLNRNVKIEFLQVNAEVFASLFVSGQLSRTAYFRLKMAELLPVSVSRVIYLDCDLLVLGDIEELWNCDMEGKPLAAIPDYGIMASSKDWPRKQHELVLKSTDMYFNSGVLLVDVDAWRLHNYEQRVLRLAQENNYQHHDQDALNKIFYAKWKALPLRWNVIPPIWNLFLKILRNSKFRREALQARKNIAILHYAGGYKPWEYKEIPSFNAEYYRYFRKTAFCNVEMPQFDHRRKGRSIRRQLYRLRLADFWQWLLG